MDRVLQSTPFTASATFTDSNGATVDPGVVTVKVDRADGTNVVAAGTTSGTGVNSRAFNLTTTQTAQLDTLTLTWTSPASGTITTYVEVVGGFLFSIADARARPDLANTSTYPTASILTARTWAETAIEHACGVAFVPRYASETLNGSGGQRMEPTWPKIRTVRSATVDGLAIDLTSVVIELERFITRPFGYWRPWPGNTVLRYEHGMTFAPPEISTAALELARYKLIADSGSSAVDPRTESIITPDGTLRLSTPGVKGQRFGIPTVDAAVEAWSELSIW